MYSAIQQLGRRFWVQELPAGVASFIVAELFYKFHSFALECLAFLATWYVLGLATSTIRGLLSRQDR